VTRLPGQSDDDDNAVLSPGMRSRAGHAVRVVVAPPGWLARAPATRIFIWLNVAVFAGEVATSLRAGASFVSSFSSRTLLSFGANYALATFREQRPEALIAACFVHASVLHILFNMFALRNVGPLVEGPAGSARMAPLYLASGAMASITSAAYGMISGEEPRVSVGASGAIFGLIGAAMIIGWRNDGFRGELTQTMLRWLVFFLAFGIAIGQYGGGLDNAAHVGGALTGIVVASLWRGGNVAYGVRTRRWVYGASAAILVATALVVSVRTIASPYAVMLASQRLDATQLALNHGDCPEARRALSALRRLRPNSAEVLALSALIAERCGIGPSRLDRGLR
jgi:rhomboid protease GluP